MHKYLFVLFCLFSVANLNGQSWKAREVSDPFNGVYTSAYVLGKSSSSVYGQPTLSLNQYDNRELILYISNAGYFRENSDVSIKWVFEGSNEIFTTYDFSCSNDGKSISILEVTDPSFRSDKLGLLEFLHLFHKTNSVTLRITNRFSNTDLTFSLIDFTKSANAIISQEKAFEAYSVLKANAVNNDGLLYEKLRIANKLMGKADEEFGLDFSSLERFKRNINKKFRLDDYSYLSIPYDSIYFEFSIYNGHWNGKDIAIYYYSKDNSQEVGCNIYTPKKDSPIMTIYKKLEANRIEQEELHAKHLYEKLNFLNLKALDNKNFLPINTKYGKSFKDVIIASIYNKLQPYGEFKIELNEIMEVQIQLSSEQKWKVKEGEILITLVDGRTIKCDDFRFYNSNDILDKADLKQIGYYGGQTIQIEIPKVSTEYLKRKDGRPKLAPIFIPE